MENEVDTINLPRKEDLLVWLVWLVIVIIFLLRDVVKAWQRWAPWIPRQAIVLNPFIIHLLSFIDYSRISVYSGSRYQTVKVEAILFKNQVVIDSGRVMMCVLIAYLIPGMARSGSITDGRSLAALACSITFHVVSEFRSDWKVEKRNESLSALAASSEGLDRKNSHLNHYIVAIILIPTIIYLLLLLIRAVIIGRPIRKFISKNVPSAISCCTPNDGPKYEDIKDHVLNCWIVARLCQPDYVLSRSSLCSTLWPTVTTCFGFYIINWIYIYNESLNSVTKGTLVQLVINWIYMYNESLNSVETLVQLVILGQIVLIGIGWIVLLVRWVTSDRQGNISGQHYFKGILQDLKSELEAHIIGLIGLIGLIDKRIHESRIRDMENRVRELFWYPRKFTVGDCKFSRTLNMLLVPGESVPNLCKANLRGFKRVERHMEQGKKDGERSPSELISLLKTITPDRETARTAVLLIQANKNSWKRTAVSLIHFMIYFYDGSYDDRDASVIADAMQCYIQGWEYMDIVDGLNKEVKSLGRQADGEFYSLQDSWNERAQPKIKQLLTKLRHKLQRLSDVERRNLQNSLDSTEVAKYCLFETGRVIDPETGRVIDPETWRVIDPETWRVIDPEINQILRLQRVLAKVYFVYMTEDVNKAVIQKCSKLAEEGREEEILEVAFLAAKAQGVLAKDREGNNRRNPVENPHNTGQASTSSTIPTETPLVGEGNGQAEATAKRIWDRFSHAVNTTLTKLKLQWLSKETTQTVYELVGEGHDTDRESTSSPIQTEIELKVIGNDHEDDAIDYV